MKVVSSEQETLIELPADCASNQSILELTAAIRQAIQEQPSRVILDGGRVVRLGSVCIGTLASFSRDLERQGNQLVLRRFSLAARRPFEICRVTEQFGWED